MPTSRPTLHFQITQVFLLVNQTTFAHPLEGNYIFVTEGADNSSSDNCNDEDEEEAEARRQERNRQKKMRSRRDRCRNQTTQFNNHQPSFRSGGGHSNPKFIDGWRNFFPPEPSILQQPWWWWKRVTATNPSIRMESQPRQWKRPRRSSRDHWQWLLYLCHSLRYFYVRIRPCGFERGRG